MPTPVIAIFDIGKTNKKCFLFDQEYHIVYEKSESLIEITDEDGDACEDLQKLTDFIFSSLDDIFSNKNFNIKAINFSAYGSALVYIDENGKPLTPLYSYLKKYPASLQKEFYDDHGGEEKMSLETASPVLGSLNAGMQLYRIKNEKTEIFSKIKYALHLPQFLSYLISKIPVSDLTSIGCHTALWNFQKNEYHEWTRKENIENLLAPIVSSDTTHSISYHGKNIEVGIGLHDSSAALIPYLKYFRDPFILISTGTWCISLNPFNHVPLIAEELKQDCLCYITHEGKPVKASRLFAGHEHDTTVKQLSLQFHKPGTYEVAYHQFMDSLVMKQHHSTQLVLKDTPVKQIFVDGGFSKNDIYMQLLAKSFKGIDVYASKMPQASALGAALAIHKKWNTGSIGNCLSNFKKYQVILLCIFCRPAIAQQIFDHAKWVSTPAIEDSIHPCPVFKKTFQVNKEIRSATLYITAHGLYEATINGRRVGKDYF